MDLFDTLPPTLRHRLQETGLPTIETFAYYRKHGLIETLNAIDRVIAARRLRSEAEYPALIEQTAREMKAARL